MKLDRGSSLYFVVALVVFPDIEEAQRCDDAIEDHRRRTGLPKGFEFHCAENSPRQREAFLDVIHEFDFHSHVFALNKAKATGRGFQYKDSVYKWTARTVMENARPTLLNAKVTLDGSGNRDFRRQLKTYLDHRINPKGGAPKPIRDVSIQPAHQNNLLQVADYVASVSARAILGRSDGARLRRNYLMKKERSFRIWPA